MTVSISTVFVLLVSTRLAAASDLDAFSYPDTAAAGKHWQPQFGSRPVRVETLDDGSACLALDAKFAKVKDRACWDWVSKLDLSQVSRISFDVRATNGGLGGNIGVYFGTPNGWYAKFWWGGVPDAWTPRTFRLDTFGTEGKPDGWDKVTTFRFSIWSTGPGKTTYRLHNFRAHPKEPGENFLVNGSFEIPGVGVPYAWGSGHWGVGKLPWAADMALWRKHWRLDKTVARYGQTSLCIGNVAGLPLQKACSVWIKLPRSVKECTASAWLRSDQDALGVTLQCAGKSAKATVGRDWTQVVLKHVPWQERMTVVISPQAVGTLWVDAVQVQACPVPTVDFHAAFRDEGIAARERLVDWSPPKRTAAVAEGRAVTGPTKKAEVEIDEYGRFLLDGKPYVQHSLGLEYVSDLPILDFAAKSGFKDVCIQIRERIATVELKRIFDRCAKVGLRIIPWLDGRMSRERFTEHIEALREHPALLCWYVYDEPTGERFAEADARVKLAKKLDPSHPALVNYLSNHLENQTGDIFSTDVYPIPHSAPNAAINAVKRMNAAAAKDGKPVWMWLQGTGYAYWMDREPSPRELSCMAYGSLIAGARGIYYFAQIPRTRECFDEMRALCVETDALTPVLCSLDAAPTVRCDEQSVLCAAFALGAEVWVLAVSTEAESVKAKFELATDATTAGVVFEGRSIPVRGGHWEDVLGPYERRVYRLSPG